MLTKGQERVYSRAGCAVFCKTKEKFGGLSNMAAGFPLDVCGTPIRTSEALYQACRFPHIPDIQRLIIDQKSPMTAKMKSKPHRPKSRPDWEEVKVAVMRWCLRVKLAQNWDSFGDLLRSTGDMPIVEESRKDPFWGALAEGDDSLRGRNVLGRLLMELRQQLASPDGNELQSVPPPQLDSFLLAGKPVGVVGGGRTCALDTTGPVLGRIRRAGGYMRNPGMAPLDFSRSALLVVDAQRGFTELCPAELPVPGGLAIVPAINHLLALPWARIDASQDWHPPDHCSFLGRSGNLYPPHCVMNTPGADFLPGLQTHRFHALWRKGSLPDFEAYALTAQHPSYPAFLRASGIDTVAVCGIATNICCFFAARDLRQAGFRVLMVEDASAGIDIPAAGLHQAKAKFDGLELGIEYVGVANISSGRDAQRSA